MRVGIRPDPRFFPRGRACETIGLEYIAGPVYVSASIIILHPWICIGTYNYSEFYRLCHWRHQTSWLQPPDTRPRGDMY